MQPASELRKLLQAAYPCPGFKGTCQSMRWDPPNAHIPRGFVGASGSLSEVEVILVVAEPGDPSPGDHCNMDEAIRHAYWAFESGNGTFHQKARLFFNLCWPGLAFEQQMKRVWVTESVLCSALQTTGPVPSQIENECANRYLRKQLEMFPKAIVVALGSKAQKRLQRIGISNFETAFAFGKPGCNQKGALPSWQRVGEIVRKRFPTK